jgi:CubicO group peptidase (beta-lactamase class C family)
MRLLTTSCILLSLALTCSAADAPRDAAPLLKPIREKHGVPAMAGAIVTGAALEAVGADGVRERGKPEPVTVDDLWHLGSCTKSMTATLCAMLVEEKKLSFDTKPRDVFRDVKADAGWKDATLRLLLTNHGGAPANLEAGGLWGRLWSAKGTPAEARRMLVEGVLSRAPEAKPGTKFIYSNAGFSIAGAMAETVMKEPWEDLLRKRLFGPLGMTSAGFGPPGTADAVDQPRGHNAEGKPVPPGPGADNPVAIGPAGIVHCSIGDWAKYVQLHLTGEKKVAAKLLSAESFVTLHAPSADDSKYAMGWSVGERPWAGGRVLSHAGSNTMWYCVTWIAPERDFAVLVTCNQGGDAAVKACDDASWALIQDHVSRATKAK